MADSEKKKRKTKQVEPDANSTEVAAVAPTEESAPKSQKKSKKEAVVEAETKEEPEVKQTETKKGKKAKESAAEPTVAETEVAAEPAPVSEKRKSKKRGKESEEVAKESVEATTEPVEATKDENHAESKEEAPKDHKASESHTSNDKHAEEPAAPAAAEPNRKKLAKRKQSAFGKFLDKLMGRSEPKEQQPVGRHQPSSSQAPSTEVAKEEEAAVAEEEPRKRKKKKPEEVAEGDASLAPEEEGAHHDEGADELGDDEEEQKSLAPPPKFPPPSAPRKAPAGPVKQELEVTSVFSMKPQIKVEVDDVQEAVEYSNEEVKRTIDWTLFTTAKPQYTIGDELSETAFSRSFAAKRDGAEPHDVTVKFFSNEPPRLLPEAMLVAQAKLVHSLAKDNTHILPILDEFIGELYIDPTKSEKKSIDEEREKKDEDDAKEDVAQDEGEKESSKDDKPKKSKKKDEAAAPVVDAPDAAKPETDDVQEAPGEKKKLKKKKKGDGEEQKDEEGKPSGKQAKSGDGSAPAKHATPPAGSGANAGGSDAMANGGDAKRASLSVAQEHDYYVVHEALPDAIRFARHSGENGTPIYSEKSVARIISGLLQALESLHASGYMHRAVSPANIVVNKSGESLLTGFEMCCKIDEPRGNVMASEKFKAPEITHAPKHNQAVDLWGVGAVAYFLLTGRQVFRETNNARLKIAIREATVVYEDDDWAHLSADSQAFCKALILKDPEARLSIKAALEHPWLANAPQTPALEKALEHLKA